MATKTVRFINSQNLLLDKLMQEAAVARNALNNAVVLCLSELGVPNGVDVTFEDVLASRSFTWEVPDAEKQQTHGPEVEGV